MNTTQSIQCPACKTPIDIDDVLTHQIEDNVKQRFFAEQKAKEDALLKQQATIETEKLQLEKDRQGAQTEIAKRVAEKVREEKSALWKDALAEAEKQKNADLRLLEEKLRAKDEKLENANKEIVEARKEREDLEQARKDFEADKERVLETERKKMEATLAEKIRREEGMSTQKLQRQIDDLEKEKEQEERNLKEQLAEKDAKLQEAGELEIQLRKEKNRLDEDKRTFELQKQRELDAERQKIAEDAKKAATDEQQFVIEQLRKQVADATKAKDELARKLEQGSQQTQGEVLELALEELLKTEFPMDEITPVPKGVSGADIVQKVLDRSGNECGQIVWEFKNTKTWSEGWIQKLKDDQRTIKAEIAILVSTALPADLVGFGYRNGIWVCDIKLAVALATAMRANLTALTHERAMSVGKNEKMEVLYAYLTGVEFKQRVETIVEAFTGLNDGLMKERVAYEKIWSEREKQIKKVLSSTVGMYGDLSGLVTLPQIKMLELESGNEDVSGR